LLVLSNKPHANHSSLHAVTCLQKYASHVRAMTLVHTGGNTMTARDTHAHCSPHHAHTASQGDVLHEQHITASQMKHQLGALERAFQSYHLHTKVCGAW
jgi:hypothetical protein